MQLARPALRTIHHALPRRRLLSASSRLLRTATADAHLRAVFDDPRLWQAISGSQTKAKRGLFGYDGLHMPSDFAVIAQRVYRRAEILVRRICEAPLDNLSPEMALLQTAKQFDRLSDILCSVIDMAEAVRQTHPNPDWTAAADEAYDTLCRFMNILNTDVRLYETLHRVTQPFLPLSRLSSQPSLFAAATLAQQLLLDFEKSGIALPDAQREQVVTLNDAMLQLSRRFFQHEDESTLTTTLTAAELQDGLDPATARAFASALQPVRGKVTVRAGSWQASAITREHPNEELRKRMYRFSYDAESPAISALEDLLRTRQELANLVGSSSYAELILRDKMAKTPENVMSFLRALTTSNRPLAQAEIDNLAAAKAVHLGLPNAELYAWDREFYSERHVAINYANAPSPEMLSPYFSVGTVIQGLSRLFSSLYGISFEVEDAPDEQLWHPSVRKLAVVDETEGKIGTMYCDLFVRPGKAISASHFTVRCARRVDDDDREGDWAYAADAGVAGSIDYRVLDEDGVASPAKEGRHQLPIIVLTCDFKEADAGQASLMTFDEVSTLFHEVGHALHSMVGRTDFQSVAGTRCATDFVELPSVLMESFASSPAVLQTFARHHQTDAPLPLDQLHRLTAAQGAFGKLSTNTQILMAAVDQAYHSPLRPGFSSTQTLYDISTEFAAIPPVPGVAWQTRFTHLTSYGASYYAYLFDRAIAGQVWRQVFAADPLDRRAGERYKETLLRHGAGRDPWECVGELLDDDRVARGDEKAMALVGQWGVEGDAESRH